MNVHVAFINLAFDLGLSLFMFRLVVKERFSVPLNNRTFSKMPTDCSKSPSLKGIIPKVLG